MQDHFENNDARELTDAELMQIQGGNIFGDAWDAVKGAANTVVNTVTNAVTHPLDTLGKIGNVISWFARNVKIPPTDSPPPWERARGL